MPQQVTTSHGTLELHSEAHGPHWVAWLTRAGKSAPEGGIVIVGETQAEAEARAREWAARQ